MGRKSSDVWEHAHDKYPFRGNYKFTCKYCSLSFVGGATVLSDHLIGGSKKRTPCLKVPNSVAKDLFEIEENKRKHRVSVDGKLPSSMKRKRMTLDLENGNGNGNGNGIKVENDMNDEEEGEGTRTTTNNNVQISDEEANIFHEDRIDITPTMVNNNNNNKNRRVAKKTTRRKMKNSKSEGERALARYFFAHSIPFSISKSPFFIDMCRAINGFAAGKIAPPPSHSKLGFSPPSPSRLGFNTPPSPSKLGLTPPSPTKLEVATPPSPSKLGFTPPSPSKVVLTPSSPSKIGFTPPSPSPSSPSKLEQSVENSEKQFPMEKISVDLDGFEKTSGPMAFDGWKYAVVPPEGWTDTSERPITAINDSS